MIDTNSLPRYRSHKLVWALEIGEGIKVNSDGSAVLPIVGLGMEPITVDAKVIHRYLPMPGDFLVYYADGYQSISPRKAFLEGYTRDDGEATNLKATPVAHEIRVLALQLAIDARRTSPPDVDAMMKAADEFAKFLQG